MIFLNKKNETNDDLKKYDLYFLLFLLISLSTGPLYQNWVGIYFFLFFKIRNKLNLMII